MTDDDIIKSIIDSLKFNALEDIKRASFGRSKIGAFILCSCLIDAMAGFEKGERTTRDDYKYFVSQHLPKYDAEKLYRDLRCKLVHGYSEGGSYLFTDARSGQHTDIEGDKIIINLENFIEEIGDALDRLAAILLDKNNIEARRLAIKRYTDNGIILTDIPHSYVMSETLSGSNITKPQNS